jgi:ABC-type amino acid transport system permease subunit
VLLPQLTRIALPGLSNNWLSLLKDTSLVSTISLVDLMRQTNLAVSVTKEPMFFYGVACLVYLLFSAISGRVRLYRTRSNRHLQGAAHEPRTTAGLVLDPDLLERYGPRFIDGLLVTAKLVAISFTLGACWACCWPGALVAQPVCSAWPPATCTSSVARRCWPSCSCCITAWARSRASGRTSACGGSSAMRGCAPCWPSP